MTALEFEQAVLDMDQIRVVVRAPSGANLSDYKFVRKATETTSLTNWLEQRIKPLTAGYEVVVIDGSGVQPHGRTQLKNVRTTYAE